MPETKVPGQVPRFELPEWRERFGVLAGITGRGEESQPFDLGLGGHAAPVGQVMARWRAFRASLPGFRAMVIAHQVHGTEVLWHETAAGLVLEGDADGHATATPGLLLSVSVADCIPVYLVDPTRRLIALLHAGWRGTAAGILDRGVALLEAHGSSPKDLVIHCGVGICGRCYEVGSEVFEGCGLAAPPGGRGNLDLRGLLAGAARCRGIQEVSVSSYCSAHDTAGFFSHRASGGADGRMVAYLGLIP
jgi:YfiH family protein